MKRLTVAIVAAIVSSAAFADPESGWKQTGAGPYVYDDPANWVGGVVNGVFGSDLTLTAAQTITFTNDLSLAGGLSIAYAGNYALTFQSNGTGAKTITLGGDITCIPASDKASAYVTFGSDTPENNLVLKLGGIRRTFTIGNVWHQRGTITNGSFTLLAGNGRNGYFNCYSAENDFTGPINVHGDSNFAFLSFQTAGARPDGVSIHLSGLGGIAGCQSAGYACGTMLASGYIDTSSTGCVAVANNENVDIDLSNYPGLSVASAGNANYYGHITPCNGVYRFCSASHVYLGAENALTGKADVLVEMPSSSTSLYLDKSNDVEGNVIVHNCGLILRNDTGMLPNAEVHVHGGNFYINSNKNTGARRAEYVHLHGGTLTCAGNGNNATTDTIGELVLDVRDPKYGVIGGINQISLNAGGKTAKLYVEKFTRANNSLWRLCGTEANNRILVGGADGENTVQFTVGNETTVQSELVGGGGAAGTTTISIYPYAIVHLGAGGYHEYDSLVTYGSHGFRPLDYETEFETSITPGTVSHVNVRLPVGSTTEIASDTTVNAVFMQGSNPNKGSTYLTGGKTLTISSGVIVMGYHRNAAPYVQCANINFGGKPGVVNFAKGKGSNWQSAIHGSAGAIFFQCDLISENNSNGTGVTISGENASASTLTGDVIIHGKVVNNSDNTFPGGTARPGNIYANGYCKLLDGTYGFNGVFGIGALFRADNSDTIVIGANGADGDFAGTLISTTKIIKESSGRQRLSGASSHTGATTVSAGVLQLDGSFTASAVTVASGATLAGCGTFGQGVTLQDGAKLEVGSAQLGADDAVMNFDGGLALSGNAAATFKVIGSDAVASFEASSVAGTGTLTVSLDSGALKSGDYLLAKSDAGIPFAYARGVNCGPLSLRSNGTELWMTKSAGLSIIVR